MGRGEQRESKRGSLRGWRRIALAWVLLCALATTAWAETPIPEFPGARGVAVAAVEDRFDALREFLDGFESKVGAEYTVCMVALSDPRDRPGRDYSDSAIAYVDDVFDAWAGRLDPKRHVLIVLAIENRGVAAHTGLDWVELGLERGQIKRVIDGSTFAQAARAGDYGEATIRLIRAIDRDLELRRGQIALLRSQLENRAEELRVQAKEIGLAADVIATRAVRRTHVETVGSVRARLPEYQAELESIGPTLDRGDFPTVRDTLTRLQAALLTELQLLGSVGQELDAIAAASRRYPARLAEVVGALDAFESEAAAASLENASVHDLRRSAAGSVAAAEAAHAEALPIRALDFLDAADRTVAQGRERLSQAIERRRFLEEELPLWLLGAAVLLLALILGILRWLHVSRRRVAEASIEEWTRKLTRGGTRLVALKDEHPYLFGRAAEEHEYTGETERVFEQMAERVDGLFLDYSAAMAQLERARANVARTAYFASKPLVQAQEQLTTDEVEVGRELLDDLSLFGPDALVHTISAAELMDRLGERYADTRKAVHEFEDCLTSTPERVRGLRRPLADLATALAALEDGGDPCPPLSERHSELVSRTDAARDGCATDPYGVAPTLPQLTDDVDTAKTSAQELVAARDAVVLAVEESLPAAEARIAALRKDEGLFVEEPGFEPAVTAHAIRGARGVVRKSVAEADADEARRVADDAQALADGLIRLVEATLTSREETPDRLDSVVTDLATLVARVPAAREHLAALRAVHADSALRPALDNIEEVEAAAADTRNAVVAAREHLSPDRQHYLAAAEIARRARAFVVAIADLLDEIAEKDAELAQARAAAERDAETAATNLARAREVLTAEHRIAPPDLDTELEECGRALDEVRAAMAAERPDWLVTATDAHAVAQWSAALAEQSENLRKTYEATLRALDHAANLDEEVGRLLAGSSEDRAHANRRHEQGRAALERARDARDAAVPEWYGVHASAEAAIDLFRESRGAAEHDFQLAAEARRSIRRAERAISSADRSYGEGVSADLSDAERLTRAAGAALRGREYEVAIDRARDAIREAEDAESEAVSEASRRLRARRRAARAAAAAAARRRSSSSSSFGSSSFGSSSFGGGSFSGGSSFGSSSGGSSFGSSSGGSSW